MKNHAQLPPYDERVIVHCFGFRCLGWFQHDNQWHNVYSQAVLPEVKGWSHIGDVGLIPVGQTKQVRPS